MTTLAIEQPTLERLADMALDAQVSVDRLLGLLMDQGMPKTYWPVEQWAEYFRREGMDPLKVALLVQDRTLHPSAVQELMLLAKAEGQPWWFPACGGCEVVCHARDGRTHLYCYRPATDSRAYYLLQEDRFVDSLE